MSHDSGSILVEARAAYRAGLCILPVASDGTKRRAVSTWTRIRPRAPPQPRCAPSGSHGATASE